MISVCMALYNGEKYVVRQILSILPQLTAVDELILVDDCSSDRTVEIIEGLKDPRIRIYRNRKNMGVNLTFSEAIHLSKGDIIFLSDQDDIWHPNKIAVCMAEFARNPNLLLVQHRCRVVSDEDGKLTPAGLTSGAGRAGILKNFVSNTYQGSAFAFRKQLKPCILPINPIPYHDRWIGILADWCGEVKFIPDELMDYVRHKGTCTTMKRGTLRTILSDRWRFGMAILSQFMAIRKARRSLQMKIQGMEEGSK